MRAPKTAPKKIGETFTLTIRDLGEVLSRVRMPIEQNYRDDEASGLGLEDLANSIASVGLLQPILVFWTSAGWAIAAGFRRAQALVDYAARHSFRTAEVKRVSEEAPDLVRLAENFDRRNPTSFETCRYFATLNDGSRGKVRSTREIADAVSLTPSHVRNLIRFYRACPERVLEAWRKDRDGRFTFAVLNEMAALKDANVDQVAAALARVLGVPAPSSSPAVPPAASSAATTTEASPDSSSESDTRGERPATAPHTPPGETGGAPRYEKLGRTGARRLLEQLEVALGRNSEPASAEARTVRDLLRVQAGESPATVAIAIVERVLGELAPARTDAPKATRTRDV